MNIVSDDVTRFKFGFAGADPKATIKSAFIQKFVGNGSGQFGLAKTRLPHQIDDRPITFLRQKFKKFAGLCFPAEEFGTAPVEELKRSGKL